MKNKYIYIKYIIARINEAYIYIRIIDEWIGYTGSNYMFCQAIAVSITLSVIFEIMEGDMSTP